MNPRRGSLLFLLIMLVSVLALVAFAFVRVVQLSSETGKAEEKVMLSKGAADAGLAHAMELIIRDYAATTTTLRTGTGTQTIANPTRLEGAWRQPFLSHFRPNWCSVTEGDYNRANAWDDVRNDDLLDSPFTVFWWHGWNYATGSSFGRWFYGMDGGFTYHDGRGRFYEPGWYNLPDTTGANVPTVPIRFTDAAPVVPDRDDGLWLDDNFKRITDPDPLVARKIARWRLRYAVGVDDIEGQLLSNGDDYLENPRLSTTDWTQAGTGIGPFDETGRYTTWGAKAGNETIADRHRRLVRWAPLYFNLVQANTCTVTAARAEHVFLNRGYSLNYDRLPAAASASAKDFPVSYPLMYREVQEPGTGADWRIFNRHNGGGQPLPDALYTYTDSSLGQITAPTISGGSPLWKDARNELAHILTGPQYSYENQRLAIFGNDGEGGMDADLMKKNFHRLYSPFGRGMSAGAEIPRLQAALNVPADPTQGVLDCPWRVNALTAVPRAVSSMIIAAIPWRSRTAHYQQIEYHGHGNSGSVTFPHDGQTITQAIDINLGLVNRDCFNHVFSTAFPYDPPSRPSPAISPDWYVADNRAAADRYPGPLMDAESTPALGAAPDDAGKEVFNHNTANHPQQPWGFCIYTTKPFVDEPGDRGISPPSTPPGSAPADWLAQLVTDTTTGRREYVWNDANLKIDANRFQFADSYFHDMAKATACAVSVLRMQWSQYDNGYKDRWNIATQPGQQFTPVSLWNPDQYRTLADLDRAFLENLGIDIANPNAVTVARGWNNAVPTVGWDNARWVISKTYDPSNNLRSLRANDLVRAGGFSSLDRTSCMELVLNDFRMSLMGASPDYATFRPLDFNGDGVVHCSGYAVNGADLPVPANASASGDLGSTTTAADAAVRRLAQWMPADAQGVGPAVTTRFTVSGTFFIGKSHFYRVVTRGELWDNRLGRPVNGVTMDSVICVDPQDLGAARANATHVLYQRYHWNKYRGLMPGHFE